MISDQVKNHIEKWVDVSSDLEKRCRRKLTVRLSKQIKKPDQFKE